MENKTMIMTCDVCGSKTNKPETVYEKVAIKWWQWLLGLVGFPPFSWIWLIMRIMKPKTKKMVYVVCNNCNNRICEYKGTNGI